MDKQLEKYTLLERLKVKKSLESGIVVQTEGLGIKMAVEGYIPVPSNYFMDDYADVLLDGNIKTDFVIGPDRIRFQSPVTMNSNYKNSATKVRTYPIVKRIVAANGSYKLTNALTIFKYFENNSTVKGYKVAVQRNSNVESNIKKVLEISEEQFERKHNDIYYKPEIDEYAMYRFKSNSSHPIAIANSFICLCSYINTVTGKIDYIIYNPEELLEVL